MRRLGFAGVALATATSCGHAEPSRTPLSPPTSHAAGRHEPSSSRAVDPSEEAEDHDEMEIVVTPSDDDDDAAATKPSKSTCAVGAGRAPDCAALPPASGCLGASIAQRACEKLGPVVDARVGAAWLSCMNDPASGPACDSHRVVTCGLRAVGGACVDGAYHARCAEIAKSCADVAEEITAPVCEHLIAAWKPERRSQMIECLRHGCETGGFGICLP